MNKSVEVRRLLDESPATVNEIAVETGWNQRCAQVAVWVLSYSGQATCVGSVPNDQPHGRKRLKLWALTNRGRYRRNQDIRRKME